MNKSARFLPHLFLAACFACAGLTGLTPLPARAQGASSQGGSADAALEQGRSLLRRGRAAEALVQLEAARKLYNAAGKKRGEAAAHDLLGELYERQGRYDVALEHFLGAHRLFVAGASESSASGGLLASAVPAAGALPTNFDGYRANLTLSKIGNMHLRRGEIAQAKSAFAQMSVTKPETSASGKVKKAGGLFGKITSLATTAAAGGTGAVTEAGSLARQGIEAYQRTIIYSAHEVGMGRAAYLEGDYAAARQHFEGALAAAKGDLPVVGQLGQTQRYRAAARTGLGDIALRQGRFADAMKLYADAARGAREDRRLDLVWPAQRGLGRSQWLLGGQEKDAKKAAKLREDALASYREALKSVETLRAGSLRADESRTTFLATIKDVFDEAAAALAETAIANAPANSSSLEGSALQYAAEGFQVVEQARARSLLDLLGETNANITEGVPADLLKRRGEIQERQEQIAGQLTGAGVTGEAPSKPPAELEKELDRLQLEYEQIENQIRTASPRYNALTSTQPLTLTQVQQQVLDGDTALLEYSLGAPNSYLWAVTKNGVSLYRLPSRVALDRQASALRDQIVPAKLRRSLVAVGADTQQRGLTHEAAPAGAGGAASAFAAAAHALYSAAVAPAAQTFGGKRLLVVADGSLNYVPFEALVTAAAQGEAADYASLPYLINTNEIVYAPSASVIAAVRGQAASASGANAARAMLLVADPVFDPGDARARRGAQATGAATAAADANAARELTLSSAVNDVVSVMAGQAAPLAAGGSVRLARLAGTRVEAQQIAQTGKAVGYKADTWLDLEASEGNLEARDLRGYRIVHFATHGLLNTERPQFTGLVLSLVGESRGDGFLRTDEAFNLRLGAPLVMLSACETGLGKEKRGEGVIGLTRALMYAGAPVVGVSLWSVSDRSTAELMSDFYQQLLSKKGVSPAAAMRAARRNMLAGKRYSAPFYWAPFVVVGDWQFQAF